MLYHTADLLKLNNLCGSHNFSSRIAFGPWDARCTPCCTAWFQFEKHHPDCTVIALNTFRWNHIKRPVPSSSSLPMRHHSCWTITLLWHKQCHSRLTKSHLKNESLLGKENSDLPRQDRILIHLDHIDFRWVFEIQDVLDEWLVCQRSWLYLEPIFSSDDINRQLPVEGKRYQTMERMWRKIMKNANDNTQVFVILL